MGKKNDPTPEELALFRQAMEGTKPLVRKNTRLNPSRPVTKRRPITPPEPFSFQETDVLQAVQGDEPVVYKQEGLSNKLLRKLRKGQYNVDAVVDLHGKTIDEAMIAVNSCLHECVREGLQMVLIIHGKGHHSDMPILKNKLNHWLRHIDVVLAFCSALPRHGGYGAMYVLLKHSSEES